MIIIKYMIEFLSSQGDFKLNIRCRLFIWLCESEMRLMQENRCYVYVFSSSLLIICHSSLCPSVFMLLCLLFCSPPSPFHSQLVLALANNTPFYGPWLVQTMFYHNQSSHKTSPYFPNPYACIPLPSFNI